MTPVDRSRATEESWHFGRVVLSLGFISPEQLQEALDAHEELKASGVHALIGDVMLDLQLITAAECGVALKEQDRLLRAAGLLGGVRGAPSLGWLVAGMVPVLSHLPPSGVIAWVGAILLGLALGQSSALRWVGVGWITAVIVPVSNPAVIAGAGSLLRGWRMHVGAALLGGTLGLIPLPETLHQAGPLLLLAAIALAVFGRKR
jgi:hypothetical protein